MNIRCSISFVLICLTLSFHAQVSVITNKLIDSLSHTTSENTKTDILIKLSVHLQNDNFVESYNYAKQAISLAEKNNYVRGMINAYNAMADAYWFHTDYAKAQSYYFKSYRICDSLKDERGIANSLYNLGWILCIQQKKYNDVTYFYRSLRTFTSLRDTEGIVRLCNAIGNFYTDKYSRLNEQINYDSAMYYYEKGIKLMESYHDIPHTAAFYSNMGDLKALAGDYTSAIKFTDYGLKYYAEMNDSAGYFLNRTNLANYYNNLGEYNKAIEILNKSLSYSLRNDNREVLILGYRNLHQAYKLKGDYAKAYEFLEKYMALNDTVNSQIFSSSIKDLQNSYDLDKKEIHIKELQQENEIQELKARQNKFILWGGGVVIVIILSILYLLYRRNAEKNVINLQLQEQNTIISQKKQEIENSIHYAKGIQTAFFPELSELQQVFPESFVFYQPKDVVSGDFYWFHKLDNTFFCAAADCTGHGVPGALMSIVSVDKITQAIFENKLTEPAEILSFLNVEIKKALKQHADDAKQKDGLDIALLKFNLNTNVLSFSSANRPLIIINQQGLNEYKPDKTAIAGFTPGHYRFTQTEIPLNKNDCIYVFSDGYADQFGGDEGKKFMTKNLKAMLQSISSLNMIDQEKEIVNTHFQWKRNYEQVDDILVIGIKI